MHANRFGSHTEDDVNISQSWEVQMNFGVKSTSLSHVGLFDLLTSKIDVMSVFKELVSALLGQNYLASGFA